MYIILYITTLNFKNFNYLYFFLKITKILLLNFNIKCNYKLLLFNNVYIYLLSKNEFKFIEKKTRLNLFNNFFLTKTKKNYNNIVFNFFNNYFINFISFFLSKKIFFCIKKLNFLVNNFKKNKVIEFMSKKLKKYYNFAGGLNIFKQFIDIL